MYTKNPGVVLDLFMESKFHYCRHSKVFSSLVFLCQVARTHRQLFQSSVDLFVYREKKLIHYYWYSITYKFSVSC